MAKSLNRRKFLEMGATSALATGVLAHKSSAATADVDVIVIGAGMAGLTAAKALSGLDYDVIVLEATDHTGGRLRTDWSLGAPFEMGAGWIHGPKGNPLSKMAAEVHAKTFVTDDDSFQVFAADGAKVPYDDIAARWTIFEKISTKIDTRFDIDQPLDRAIAKVAPKASKDPILNWMFSAYTEFDAGGPLDQLSAYYVDEDEAFDGPDVIVTSGYDALLKPLAKGLDIRLNQPVTRITYEAGDGAAITTPNATYNASYVICTAPLGVLQSGSITFDPPLPKTHRKRIAKIGMGSVTKLALKFETAFWPLDTQYFGLMTQQKGRWNYWLNYRVFSDENILLGLCMGDYAWTADKMSDAEMITDAMQAIHTMFGLNTPAPVAHQATHWSQNPYSGGAYSFTKVGVTPKDFDALMDPIADTLILAGEHTIFKYHATVHGAHFAGLKAANIIENDLD